MKGTVRGLAVAAISAGALIAAAGCGGTPSGHVTADRLNAAAHAAAARITQRAPATPPVAPAPAVPSPGVSGPGSSPATPAAPAAAPSMSAAAGYQGPHFGSPESAMAYLASAFNSGNAADLHAVTTPDSYLQLTQMWTGPVNLQLQYCTPDASRGDYYCYFSHDYPASAGQTGQAVASMIVAPAVNPGWYLYSIVECG